MQRQFSAKDSYLAFIHMQLTQLHLTFRQLVCRECAWSIPTFYRKVRSGDISNAEQEKIISITNEVLEACRQECLNESNGIT